MHTSPNYKNNPISRDILQVFSVSPLSFSKERVAACLAEPQQGGSDDG